MPRKSRIDAPGALHHIIARGNEQRKIFRDDQDSKYFLERLGVILTETEATCYAWALIPNHFHLLLRTGSAPMSTVMRRLLTSYAIYFNRRHNRYGHLFQNRYKSILCQEDPYFLELVRYIHLNPLRSHIVKDIKQLDRYPYSGHSVLMGKYKREWQDSEYVLKWFDKRLKPARTGYKNFIQKAISMGKRSDLIGGGLIRSVGSWSNLKSLRKAKVYLKGDERILGESSFVEQVLSSAEEALEKKYLLQAEGWNVDKLAAYVAELLNMETEEVWAEGKYKRVVQARSLLCYWSARQLGVSLSSLASRLNISPAAVSKAVSRGEKLANENQYRLQTKVKE